MSITVSEANIRQLWIERPGQEVKLSPRHFDVLEEIVAALDDPATMLTITEMATILGRKPQSVKQLLGYWLWYKLARGAFDSKARRYYWLLASKQEIRKKRAQLLTRKASTPLWLHSPHNRNAESMRDIWPDKDRLIRDARIRQERQGVDPETLQQPTLLVLGRKYQLTPQQISNICRGIPRRGGRRTVNKYRWPPLMEVIEKLAYALEHVDEYTNASGQLLLDKIARELGMRPRRGTIRRLLRQYDYEAAWGRAGIALSLHHGLKTMQGQYDFLMDLTRRRKRTEFTRANPAIGSSKYLRSYIHKLQGLLEERSKYLQEIAQKEEKSDQNY